ncbi:hypothetical protein [Actinoplanes sp. HUAS TT8]|uniref:hypothetical protein n=1 Tax=Actinoplanes sp. HUAS TT8 TaxID=3447453 RepID=UPI003F522805
MNEPITDAFRLLRTMHPTATRVVVEDVTDTLWLYAVRGPVNELLWFDADNYGRHPDADALFGSPELDYAPEVIGQVVDLLLRAYPDAFSPASPGDYERPQRREGHTLLTVSASDASPPPS